ncbi:cation:proton antiporter [Streptomyces hyaluromycini]|uniref:cation:proton antiporter n=1 Tax=Streptomyces hyaluromycini TaxID=1377993 RepID=UPI000B5C410F|nr:cation:proton antiporter [Streptomyces hyaluromycini]
MTSHQIAFLLLDLALVLSGCALLGALATRMGQPAVMGEILGGILLGPTVLGPWSHTVVPDEIRPPLTGIGNVGVALFMFGLGLEFHRSALRGGGRRPAGIAIGSMLLPFVLGSLLGVVLVAMHYRHPPDPMGFVLFLGIAMSVTAFPVLSRILTDRQIAGTEVGMLAMAVAAVGDVLAWSGLAGVIALVGRSSGVPWLVALVVPFVFFLVRVVQPTLRRLLPAGSSTTTLAYLSGGALACGAVTELLGLHFIFGAFLFGLITPRIPATERLAEKVFGFSRLLLPTYFVVAGLQVNLGLTSSALGLLAVIVLVAVVGKVAGTYGAARMSKLSPGTSALLAVLMNTRGLTELIVLTTGLRLGLIDQELYSAMVVMALLTTAATGPLLTLCGRRLGASTPTTVTGTPRFDPVPAPQHAEEKGLHT